MVDGDTRNNLIVIIILIATAIIITAFVAVFYGNIADLAQSGESTINTVGKSVAGNISLSAEVNKLNLHQFNKSIDDVIRSNDKIVVSNNRSINNLTHIVHAFNMANSKYLGAVTNNTGANKGILMTIIHELKTQTAILQNISKKLDIVPVTPVVVNKNGTIPQNCVIKTPTVCILANGGGIILGPATKH